jgi:uncharacterized membrane protein
MIYSALFAALTCIATMVIKIPTPGTGGYIHPGDSIVILSGIFLGPVYGALSASIGSAMADVIGGYFFYAPATFLIKGFTALLCGYVYQFVSRSHKSRYPAVFLCGLIDTAVISGGYYIFEIFFYGVKGALVSIPANLIQGASGLILAMILYPILVSIPGFSQRAFRK